MLTAGPRAGGTFADDAAVGSVAWSNPGNAVALDSVYAIATVNTLDDTHYLKATNFGFTIDPTAQIVGITARIVKTSVATIQDAIVKLLKAGVVGGGSRLGPFNWGTPGLGDVAYPFNGSQFDLWDQTWTPSDINDAGFGLVISGHTIVGTSQTASIDFISLSVNYLLPNGIFGDKRAPFAASSDTFGSSLF